MALGIGSKKWAKAEKASTLHLAIPDRRPVNALAETRRLQRMLHTPARRGRGR